MVLLAAAVVVIAIYLLYQPYPEWWYLRFLIPALVLLLILASAVAVELATRARMGGVIPIVAVLLAILGTRAAGDRQAFELQRMEGRYRDTAALITDRLPANAVLITVWQSGSVRFHAGRDAVLWDSLDPAWLDRAIAWLSRARAAAVSPVRTPRRTGISRPVPRRISVRRARLAAAPRSQSAGTDLRPRRSRAISLR